MIRLDLMLEIEKEYLMVRAKVKERELWLASYWAVLKGANLASCLARLSEPWKLLEVY